MTNMTAKKDFRTINATNMPKKVLNAFLSGELDWEETYAIYPGPDYYIGEDGSYGPVNNDDCAICGDDCIDSAHDSREEKTR